MLIRKMSGVAVTSIATLIIASNSYAAVPGPYAGAQLGLGKVHQNGLTHSEINELYGSALGSNNFTVKSSNNYNEKNTGLAGRLFAGYQFDENWAAELGWARFSNTSSNTTSTVKVNGTQMPSAANAKGTNKTDAFDLVGKGILPLQNNFSLYGKLGLAYLVERTDSSATVNKSGKKLPGSSFSDRTNSIFPTFGVGVAYDVTPNVVADVSWNRIQKIGSSNLNSTDFVGAGLSYHFG
jgi:OmpA-OmpF porin, OOP family